MPKFLVSAFALTGALGAFAISSPAFGEDKDTGARASSSGQLICSENLSGGDHGIYLNESNTLRPEFDPLHACEKNAGEESASRNAQAALQTPDIFRKREEWTKAKDNVRGQGACRLVYTAIKDVYDEAAKRHEKFCADFQKAQVATSACSGIDKDCRSQWEDLHDKLQVYGADLKATRKTLEDYLTAASTGATMAQDAYKKDLAKLERAHARAAEAGASLGDSVKEAPELKPAYANKTAKSLDDYYDLLKNAGGGATLPDEEAQAVQRVKNFRNSLISRLDHYHDTATQGAEGIQNAIAQLDQQKSMLKDGKVEDTMEKIGPAAGAASAISQSSHGGGGDVSSSGGGGGSGGSSGETLAAAAGVAGLGGALAGKSSAEASSSPSPSTAAPANTPEAPAAAAPGPTVSTLGNAGAAKPEDHAANPNAAKPEGPVVKAEDVGGAGAGAAGAPPSLDSSSRSLPGNHRNPSGNGPASPEASAAVPEALGTSFGPNLSPKPSSKPGQGSPNSEVANLLGQMKNLFNMDESAPGGGMPGGLPPLAAPPSFGATPAAAEAPLAADAAPPEEAAPAEGPAPANAETPREGTPANLFGKADTSIFARVHSCHQRCMKRGLVLYGLKERIE